jgi:CubicO group peptidase (beta-lactamase class C family)
MMQKIFLCIFLTNISCCIYAQKYAAASDKLKPEKTINLIKVDGVLNEPVWQKAVFTNRLYDKEDSVHYYDNTKTYFTYDADNFYVGFKCKVKDNSLLPKIKLDKDDQTIIGNEMVAFCVDSYNDGVVAYVFMVDAAGNKIDLTLNSGKDLSNSFSSDWTSVCKRDTDGYTIEMKIPLAKLPIQWNKENVEMGVQMIRVDKQNNKELKYPFLNSKIPNNLNQFQKVVLKGINKTHPENLSGVNLKERLAFKKSKIDISTLIGRCKGGDASVMDYAIFKSRAINGSDKTRELKYALQTKSINNHFVNTKYIKDNFTGNEDFETFLERTQTTAFLVLQNDTLVYEKYFNGFNKNSTFTSFSVAKSFVSTLIGIAISEGFIKSDSDKITTYIPELIKKDARFSAIAIKDLLSMSSGLVYSEDGFPSDADITYQSPNLRKAVLENIRIEEAPGKHWHYNNYNLLLMGLILERTTNMSVSKYMEEKLWKKMGGDNASWSLDEHGFEKMESGINCSAYDYARFAALLLNNGKYNNIQVVPEDWIRKTTQPENKSQDYYDLPKYNIFYSGYWWGKFRSGQENKNDFFGMGNKGEYVYVCPQEKLIIIRLGFEYGLPTPAPFSWPEIFYEFATDFRETIKRH